MKEGLEFGRLAQAETREAVRRKVLSEVSHDPSKPQSTASDVPQLSTSVTAIAASCPPAAIASVADVPAAGVVSVPVALKNPAAVTVRNKRPSAPKVAPDPDSTTTGAVGNGNGLEKNLNSVALRSTEDDIMDFGVDEKVTTQPFTSIKEPSKAQFFVEIN